MWLYKTNRLIIFCAPVIDLTCFSSHKQPSMGYFYYLLLEFFTPVLADGFSLEFEWQQVSSSLQDSSQYSGRSQ